VTVKQQITKSFINHKPGSAEKQIASSFFAIFNRL